MRIWLQSATSLGYDPKFDLYRESVKRSAQKVIRADTVVDVKGVKVYPIDASVSDYFDHLHNHQIFENGLQAEKEGYDAFVIGCTYDGGLEEGRELLSMPVVGISQTSYYMAAMLGELFATVTTGAHFLQHYRQQIRHYGLESKHLPGPYIFQASEEELAMAQENPEPMMEKFKVVAEKAVADGASVIIPNPAFLASLVYKTGLTRVGDATVIDTISTAVKFAEMLVDLKKIGIEVSKTLQVYGSPGKELLKESLDKYAPVFKIDT